MNTYILFIHWLYLLTFCFAAGRWVGRNIILILPLPHISSFDLKDGINLKLIRLSGQLLYITSVLTSIKYIHS